MGVSTNAIIAYGFDLGDELPEELQQLLEEHEYDMDECLAASFGLDLPKYQPDGDYKAYSEARETVINGIKIDLVTHCSGECPMYFLAARGSDKSARRGYPYAIDLEELLLSKLEECHAMREFCEKYGIEWQAPKWHIFSMWN